MTGQMWNQRMSERWRIILWLATGMLLSSVLLFAANWEADRQERLRLDSFRGDVADLARISKSIIDGKLRSFDDSLLVLREAFAADPTRFAENIRLLRSGPLADREILVVLVDREGHLEYTDTKDVKTGLYLGDRKYFRFFADGGKDRLYVDEPSLGRVTRRYTLPLARPVYDRQGGFIGVVAISVKQQSLVDFGSRLKLSGDTTITIVNLGGAVVSSSRDFSKIQGTTLPPDKLAPMLKSSEGIFSARATPDSPEQIIAFRHIHNEITPLIIYVTASPENVLRETSLGRIVFMWSAFFTSLVIIALIVVYLKGRKTSAQLLDTLLRSKEHEYETLTGTTLDGFFIADSAGRILDSNTTFCTMLGFTQEELLCQNLADIEAAEMPDQVAVRILAVRDIGSARFQTRYRCKDGTIIDVEVSAQYVYETDGRYFVFVRDVTERKLAEDMLHDSEERLHLATRATNIGIWDWNVVKNELTWDDSMYSLYDIRKEDFGGAYDAWSRTLHPEDRQPADAEIQAALRGEREYAPEFRIIRSDGTVRFIKAASQTFFDENGKPLRMIGTNYDITEHKLFEKELQEKNSELERFTYTVSHDLKSPLITIMTFAGYILKDFGTERLTHIESDLRRVVDAAAKMSILLDDLLKLSRVGRTMNPPSNVDMGQLVNEVLTQLAGRINQQQITVTVQPDLPESYGDRQRIAMVLQNLVENALKYRGDQPAFLIEIGARADQKQHVYFVRDNGIGIESRYHESIFDLFTKLDSKSEGTGIGLSLVKRIIDGHGGKIWVESDGLGTGSTFCFALPKVGII